jgi:hypothetical protein
LRDRPVSTPGSRAEEPANDAPSPDRRGNELENSREEPDLRNEEHTRHGRDKDFTRGTQSVPKLITKARG